MFRRAVLFATLTAALAPGSALAATPTWVNVKLPDTSKRVTEPRVIVGPDDRRWVVTNLNAISKTSGNDTFGAAVVFVSRDGGQTWQRTAADPPQKSATIDTDIVAMHPVTPGGQPPPRPQKSATIDTDIVAMHPVTPGGQPRILASELDDGGLNFPSGITDDGGKTWTETTGSTELADQDRQWFAVGPDDPSTKQPTVYLLYHNLGSGFAQHNM